MNKTVTVVIGSVIIAVYRLVDKMKNTVIMQSLEILFSNCSLN